MKISKEKKIEDQSHSFLSHFSQDKIKILEDENGKNYVFVCSKNLLVKVNDNSEIDELVLNLELNKKDDKLPEISIKQGNDIEVDFFSENKKRKYDLLFKERDDDLSEKISDAYGGYIKPPLKVFLNSNDFSNGTHITKEIAEEYIKLAMEQTKIRQQKSHRPVSEYSVPKNTTQEEILTMFALLIEQLYNQNSDFKICELKDLEYNGKSHLSEEEAANKLMEQYTRLDNESREPLLDISELPVEIQILLTKKLYDKEIVVTQDEREAIRDYQSLEYDAFKAMTNSSKEKYLDSYLENLINGKIKRMTLDRTVKDIYTLIDLFDKLPERKIDLLISRIGSEEMKDDGTIGYDNFTSFGTNLGTNTMENKNTRLIKTVLKKNDPAIPIIFLIERKDWDVYKECEMLLPPSDYKATEGEGYIKIDRQDFRTNDILDNMSIQLSKMEEKVQEMITKSDIPNDKINEISTMIKSAKAYILSKKSIDTNNLETLVEKEPAKSKSQPEAHDVISNLKGSYDAEKVGTSNVQEAYTAIKQKVEVIQGKESEENPRDE